MYRYAYLVFCMILLSACVEKVNSTGYSFDEDKFSAITTGESDKVFVLKTLGSPSSISTFGEEAWYYIYSEYGQVAFFEPYLKNQTVAAVIFDNDTQLVKKVAHYNQEDAKDIAFSEETTPTEGNDITVLQQLLGNIGRFNASDRNKLQPRNTSP